MSTRTCSQSLQIRKSGALRQDAVTVHRFIAVGRMMRIGEILRFQRGYGGRSSRDGHVAEESGVLIGEAVCNGQVATSKYGEREDRPVISTEYRLRNFRRNRCGGFSPR